MPIKEIKENVFMVGATDWDIRDFHGYSTERGTTYNAFLVKDEKVALFDTVKYHFKDDLVYHISQVVDPIEVDYIIVNHVEMDHSGCLPEIIELCKPEKIICSKMGHKALLDHFHREDWPYEIVKSGDSISLGSKTVSFVETKMLHWPDSMVSYIPEDKLLISNDAFGQHFATSAVFADEVSQCEIVKQAEKYYANILMPLSHLVQNVLATITDLGLDIDMIAPDHGLIWRTNKDDISSVGPGTILGLYDLWSKQEKGNKALVIYDSMWESTARLAKAIGGELIRQGIDVKMMNLGVNHRSDIITEVMGAKAVLFGSPTLNNGMLPSMADFLCYLKGLKPKGLVGAAFGSFGWSGEAVRQINKVLEEMKIELVDPGLRVKYVPSDQDYEKCRELAAKVVKAMNCD